MTDSGSICPCCGQPIPAGPPAAPTTGPPVGPVGPIGSPDPNPVLDERAFQKVWQSGTPLAWPPAPRPGRSSGSTAVGCLVAGMLTFLVVSVAFVALLVSSGDGSADSIDPGSDTVLPVPGADAPSWIVEKQYSSALMRVESGRDEPVWVSEPLAESGLGPRLAVDDRRAYASDGRRVLALDLATGKQLWSVLMDDDVESRTTACTACFEVVGGRLVVATIDGEIHVLDVASGNEIWSHRFADPSGRALMAGGSIVLIDERDEGLPGHQLVVVDPEDGRELSRVVPSCPAADPNGAPALLSFGDVVFPVDGEAAVIVELGGSPACRQRIDVSTGETVWSVPLVEKGSLDGIVAIQHDEVRYTATFAGIERLDLATGDERLLVAAEESEALAPAAVVDGVLLVTSRNNRGSATSRLVGVDPATGDRSWSHDMDRVLPPLPNEPEVRISETSPVWLWAAGGEGNVRVMIFAVGRDGGDTEPTVSVDELDARSGKSRSRSDVPVGGVSSSFEFRVLERPKDALVLNLEGRLRVLDTRTGRVSAGWP